MAKLKGKSKTSTSAAAAAKKIADPAPSSEPVEEISNAGAEENTAVLDDKSKGAAENNKEEGTENAGFDEQEGIDVEEETKDGLDAKLGEEVDDVEEAKDGLDDESDEGDELEVDAEEEDGVVEPVGTDIIPGGGKIVDSDGNAEGEAKIEEVKVDKNDDAKEEGGVSNKKSKRVMRKKKTTASSVAEAVSNDAGKTQDNSDKQGAPVAGKELKMADGTGLVFMCNAKTKQDCFNYKVFGLPASKKEMVAKIYKGMRLFLFDIDLKLMYGVYKAASLGGYSIEPKAFNSAFPAQVRFSVLNECVPLPEDKFKEAIKENYFAPNKFDTQLSPQQVKNLCKLFEKAGKNPATREEPTSSARGGLKRKMIPRPFERERGNPRGGDHHHHRYPTSGDHHPHHHHMYADRREAYPPPPVPTYAYGQQGGVYYQHQRDPPPPPPPLQMQVLDPRDYHRAVDPRQAVVEYGGMYREPLPPYMGSASYAAAGYAPPPPPAAPQAGYVPSSTLYYRY